MRLCEESNRREQMKESGRNLILGRPFLVLSTTFDYRMDEY